MMPFGPYGPGPWGWGWMVGGWIMMLVFWGLLIAGVVVLVRALTNRNVFGQPGHNSALEILRRRYASGEITKDQFEEMKRTLG
jgi:putative membrane protein